MRTDPDADSTATIATTHPPTASLARINVRRWMRSATAPPSRRNATLVALSRATAIPSCSGDPPSARIWNGTATFEIELPMLETVCPVRSRRKSRWRRGARTAGSLKAARLSAQIGHCLGSVARSLLYSGSSFERAWMRSSCFLRSESSMSNALETMPMVSSKPRLQLRRQPFIRSRTYRSSLSIGADLLHVDALRHRMWDAVGADAHPHPRQYLPCPRVRHSRDD